MMFIFQNRSQYNIYKYSVTYFVYIIQIPRKDSYSMIHFNNNNNNP